MILSTCWIEDMPQSDLLNLKLIQSCLRPDPSSLDCTIITRFQQNEILPLILVFIHYKLIANENWKRLGIFPELNIYIFLLNLIPRNQSWLNDVSIYWLPKWHRWPSDGCRTDRLTNRQYIIKVAQMTVDQMTVYQSTVDQLT